MSGDEVIVLVGSGFFAAVVWAAWYWRVMRVNLPRRSTAARALLLAGPALALVVLYAVLRAASASDVRDDPRYLLMYLALGAAWLVLATWWLPAAGISPRDDAIERGNTAAGIAVGAALVAVMLCYAGGNVGDGPGWWVVVFSAGLATGALFLVWLLFEAMSGVSDVVTVDRDVAAGIRLGAFVLACGAIFGRAAAGDWISVPDTVRDFIVVALPAIVLLAAATLVERVARPTPSRPRPSPMLYGATPALAYVGTAALHLVRLGPPA